MGVGTRAAVGIDIGGSSIKAGLVAEDGRLLRSTKEATDAQAGPDALFEKVRRMTRCLLMEAPLEGCEPVGIGIGTAGQVHAAKRVIASATPNLPGWSGYPLAAKLEADCGLPVSIDNDANMMAAGEAWLGAGKAWSTFVCVTLGTGVGGGIVLGGKPYVGRNGFAGEIGHLTIRYDGVPCNCGRIGCWEQYASVTALRRMIAEQLDPGFDPDPSPGSGSDGGEASPESLFASARAGEAWAIGVVDAYAEFVAIGLGTLIHIFEPQGIVVGGAVTAQGDFLFDRIRRAAARHTMPVFLEEPIPIVPAALGDEAAVYGAAAAVFAVGGE